MTAHEIGARSPTLPGADTEKRKKGRPWNQYVK
jgi:hypothetical protein